VQLGAAFWSFPHDGGENFGKPLQLEGYIPNETEYGGESHQEIVVKFVQEFAVLLWCFSSGYLLSIVVEYATDK
jgi:hypothetical protein